MDVPGLAAMGEAVMHQGEKVAHQMGEQWARTSPAWESSAKDRGESMMVPCKLQQKTIAAGSGRCFVSWTGGR